MRKLYILTFLLSLLIAKPSFSQTDVVEYEQTANALIDYQAVILILYAITEMSVAGEGQTWSYNLVDPNFELEVSIHEPETQIGHEEFPEATHAVVSEVGSFATSVEYLKYDANSERVSLLGTATDASDELDINVYTDSKILYQYPLDFGIEYSDTYAYEPLTLGTGFQTIETGERHTEGDATGVLNTPYGKYTDVVRLRITESGTQESYNDGNLLQTNDFEKVTHEFWSPGIPIPVASFFQNMLNGNQAGVQSSYIEDNVNSTSEVQRTAFFVFPNPAKNQINIESMFGNVDWDDLDINLVSIDSKMIPLRQSINFNSNSYMTINLPELATGIYFLQVTSPEFSWTQKILIKK